MSETQAPYELTRNEPPEFAPTRQDGQGEVLGHETGKTVSDFVPLCKHHFDYFPARQIWLIFRCLHCGLQFQPDDVCAMLNRGQLVERGA